jgi:hypothetical protein
MLSPFTIPWLFEIGLYGSNMGFLPWFPNVTYLMLVSLVMTLHHPVILYFQ